MKRLNKKLKKSNNNLEIIIDKKSKARKYKDINEIADSIMERFDDVFKKLAKS